MCSVTLDLKFTLVKNAKGNLVGRWFGRDNNPGAKDDRT